MKRTAILLASALLLVPVAAQAADCGSQITQISNQLDATRAKLGVPAQAQVPQRTHSGWAITWNRMATAEQNAWSASLPPADVSPTGTEDAVVSEHQAFATGKAHTLMQVQDSLQTAQAAHARGDDAACQRELADAQQLLQQVG